MDFGMPVLIFFPNDRRSARVGYGNHREAVLCTYQRGKKSVKTLSHQRFAALPDPNSDHE